jgi:glycosyltransferase involved in cell wall biosynthesis
MNDASRQESPRATMPLCPPEIPYPWTARGRKERARVFLLEGSHVPEHLLAGIGHFIPMRWSSREITCEANVWQAAWECLHLGSFRFDLTSSICILTPQALNGISYRQRPLLFEYAQRHGLRVICLISGIGTPDSALDTHVFLADTVVCENTRIRDWLMKQAQAPRSDAAQRLLIPQIRVADGGRLDLHSELISFPPLTIVSPVEQQSALLNSIRRGQEGLDTLERVTWLSPGTDIASVDGARDKHDWLMLVSEEGESAGLAARLARKVGAPENVAVLVLGKPLNRLNDHRCAAELSLLAQSVRVILFEEESSYRSFFERCCKLNAPISILRRKAVLLSDHSDGDLIERLVRCLRLRSKAWLGNRAQPSWPAALASGITLSVCISTYNRADWLRVTLPLIAGETAQHDQRVELLVVDNASTDDTELVAKELAQQHSFSYHRNERNVGMLGNLGICAKCTSGDYIWILGDDDLVKPGTVSLILEAVAREPSIELFYLNYAYTHFDSPQELEDATELMARGTPIAEPTQSGFYPHIWQMAALNENFFTSIFACIFRRDHGLAAYTQYTDFPPFSNMQSAIPTTKYVLTHMMDRPGYWIGTPQLVVNMNVSWARYSPVWHIERFPEVFDLAEANGVPEADLRRYRESNLGQALHFLRELDRSDGYVVGLLSLTRYIESMKRAPGFSRQIDELLTLYQQQLVRPEGLPARRRLSAATLRSIYNLRTLI